MTLRRYTNLAQTLNILKTSELTLMNPESWDDKNDSFYMNRYKTLMSAKTVAALCFAGCAETYHHWSVFSKGNDGICLHFKRIELTKHFQKDGNISIKAMSYKTLDEIKSKQLKAAELPFVKRKGYSDEKEFRMLFTSMNEEKAYPRISFPISTITRITVSPWLHDAYFKDVKEVLKATGIPSSIGIYKSTLTGNRAWQKFAEDATE